MKTMAKRTPKNKTSNLTKNKLALAKRIYYLASGGMGDRGEIDELASILAVCVLKEEFDFDVKNLFKISGWEGSPNIERRKKTVEINYLCVDQRLTVKPPKRQ